MRTLQRVLILPALLLVVNACSRHKTSAPATPAEPSLLHVENHHWLDVDVYVFHDGQRSRLGTVTAASSKDFVFPRSMVGSTRQVRLIADPVGSSSGTATDPITLRPGTRVNWTLESSLDRSSLTVY
jgi:hypothetical protein